MKTASPPFSLRFRTLIHDDDASGSIGCSGCLDRPHCGGQHVNAALIDCMDLCCGGPATCGFVCPTGPNFGKRLQEIGGFGFDSVIRTQCLEAPGLPDYVPLIHHGYSRSGLLARPAVAVPLMQLVDMKRSAARFDRGRLFQNFRLAPGTTLIATGIDKDERIERWWRLDDRRAVVRDLIAAGVSLVTVPNFSSVLDAPAHDGLYAMKRILLTWAEFVDEGMPAALHVNARRPRDYERYLSFIVSRPEVRHISFEFITGTKRKDRGAWHTDQLCRIAQATDRPLVLVVRGGQRWLPRLRQVFTQVVSIDATAHQRAKFRQGAELTGNRLRWARHSLPLGEPIDVLLAHNIDVCDRHAAGLASVGTHRQ